MASRKIATCSALLCALSACASSRARDPVGTPEAPQAGAIKKSHPLRNAVVSVSVQGQSWDWTNPWSKQRPWTRYVNGLVVDGRRILVVAEHLGNQTLLEVTKLGEPQRYPATVALIDYEIPLALLTVESEEFWKGLDAQSIASDVPTEGEVRICRWLSTGQFEEASGAVRQVLVDDHWPGQASVLTLDVSTSIEGAGWSEVITKDDTVIGLATNHNGNRLSILAAPVLKQFLESAAKKPYPGMARHGFIFENLTNPAMRRQLGLADKEDGILVRRVAPHGSAAGALEPGDVLLEVDGKKIDRVGKFDHSRYGRLFFGVLFTDGKTPGEALPMKVLRKGQRIEVKAALRRISAEQDLVPPYSFDTPPEWFAIGGMIFQPLTRPYLQTWRDWWKRAPLRLLIVHDEDGSFPTPERKRVMVLSRVLPDPVNLGYQDMGAVIVSKINGAPVQTVEDVRAAFAKPQGGFHVIDLLPGQSTSRIVLDAAELAAAEERIRSRYGVPAP